MTGLFNFAYLLILKIIKFPKKLFLKLDNRLSGHFFWLRQTNKL